MNITDKLMMVVLLIGWAWLTWCAVDVFILGQPDPVMESCRSRADGLGCPAFLPSVLGVVINSALITLLVVIGWVGTHPIKDEVK